MEEAKTTRLIGGDMSKLIHAIALVSMTVFATPVDAQKLCPGLTGSARTDCLKREVAVAQSIAKDRNDAAKAYDTAYKAAAAGNAVLKATAGAVAPGGSAVYGAAQAATDAALKAKKKK